ncbi:MAG: D-tyrosyl-tRNA(Tyr) deacylase [bacterium ADurb.Bin236]|nr:MAG: D-tyrosyl-tRNA(Tyr) deacylase [bacterium ADurb.Bin236]HOY65211.1 D-aminoacyl-tRNA deacylase [bacterium]HPN94777.1 D-aminoacyl-tRNA deacylase [bacterium]
MKAVAQRVKSASVSVDGVETGRIGPGLVVFLGVSHGDTEADVDFMVRKIVNLRVFEDEAGKMNLSALDLNYGLLAISQFTLLGDCRKGNRPNFTGAAPPEEAEKLYELFKKKAAEHLQVACGVFGAMMEIEAMNHGPVTIIIESPKSAGPDGG